MLFIHYIFRPFTNLIPLKKHKKKFTNTEGKSPCAVEIDDCKELTMFAHAYLHFERNEKLCEFFPRFKCSGTSQSQLKLKLEPLYAMDPCEHHFKTFISSLILFSALFAVGDIQMECTQICLFGLI